VGDAQRTRRAEKLHSGLRVARQRLGQRIPSYRNDQNRPGQGPLERESEILRVRSPHSYRISGEGEGGVAGFAKGGAKVTVCDINRDMLAEGMRRAQSNTAGISWLCGDAEKLPIEDASQDAYIIGFGIRNVTHLDKALSEAYRVLKPGGHFLCLEFSRVTAPGLDELYDLYSFAILPRLGEAVAGDGAAYRYLAESIRRWPAQGLFAKLIGNAGFSMVKFRNLSGGIAAIHSGWKL
jgi:demethylmenaquinone methyltransferase/2-methoxy-6-polyprenyl-1,4-benzoquinol methylase